MNTDPALANHLFEYAVAMGLVVSGYFWHLLRSCRCDSCVFHKTERMRIAAQKKSEAETEARKQEDLAHEYAHKGGAWVESDPDKFDCSNKQCRRNKHKTVD